MSNPSLAHGGTEVFEHIMTIVTELGFDSVLGGSSNADIGSSRSVDALYSAGLVEQTCKSGVPARTKQEWYGGEHET
jgi:hypothetical protein